MPHSSPEHDNHILIERVIDRCADYLFPTIVGVAVLYGLQWEFRRILTQPGALFHQAEPMSPNTTEKTDPPTSTRDQKNSLSLRDL
jgi:hypothetical protein